MINIVETLRAKTIEALKYDDDTKEFYSFENTELFRQALTELTELQGKLKIKY